MPKKHSNSFNWSPSTYAVAKQAITDPFLIPHIRNAIRLGFTLSCPPPPDDPNGRYEVRDQNGMLTIEKVG